MSYLPLAAGVAAVKAWPHGKQILSYMKNCANRVLILILLQCLDAKHRVRILRIGVERKVVTFQSIIMS